MMFVERWYQAVQAEGQALVVFQTSIDEIHVVAVFSGG
jgi:hypothetical protein